MNNMIVFQLTILGLDPLVFSVAITVLLLLFAIVLYFFYSFTINRSNSVAIIEFLGKYKRIVDKRVFFIIIPFEKVVGYINKSDNEFVKNNLVISKDEGQCICLSYTIKYSIIDYKNYFYYSREINNQLDSFVSDYLIQELKSSKNKDLVGQDEALKKKIIKVLNCDKHINESINIDSVYMNLSKE